MLRGRHVPGGAPGPSPHRLPVKYPDLSAVDRAERDGNAADDATPRGEAPTPAMSGTPRRIGSYRVDGELGCVSRPVERGDADGTGVGVGMIGMDERDRGPGRGRVAGLAHPLWTVYNGVGQGFTCSGSTGVARRDVPGIHHKPSVHISSFIRHLKRSRQESNL